jgi:pimeloyl-ACP methyl ester carboxylesterase
MQGESYAFAVDGRRLHAVRWGDAGAPLLLAIHGAGAHARWWDALAPHWRPWHVIAPDLRGHGESDPAERYLIEDFASDLLPLLDTLAGGRRAALVGHSMGGRVAVWIAVHHPQRVESVALLDTRLGPVPRERAERWRGTRAADAPARTYPSRAAAEAAFRLTPREPGIAPALHAALAAHAVRQLDDGTWALRFDRRALQLEGSRIADLLPLVARIRCPTLYLRGSDSTVIGEAQQAAVAAALPHATVDVVPGGHHFPLADPDGVAARVAAFLAQHPLPRWRGPG